MIYDFMRGEIVPSGVGELTAGVLDHYFQGRVLTGDIFFFAEQQRLYWSKGESEKRIKENRKKFNGRFPSET